MTDPDTNRRAAESSQPEDAFVELFAQVFGIERTQLLAPEYPVADIDGATRYIDFALKAAGRLIAFEIDGPSHYQPPDFDLDKFEDDLGRQNSLIHHGWQVFRWSDRQLAREPERVKDQLALFLEHVPGLLELADFLPRQSGAAAELNPELTLGLTATPDRPDGRPILEIFRDVAHRLSLEEAIRRGELVPIRCVRVKTNVDLSRVRFNEVRDNRHDLEQTVTVPARNDLIVDTYLHHVPGRKGVTFCVNVAHAKAMDERFRSRGVPARAVSGAMRAEEREAILRAFAGGGLKMLCACDILNEGWDCPDVEVLLMARPTLSKIIYMQQLGRGTRKAPSPLPPSPSPSAISTWIASPAVCPPRNPGRAWPGSPSSPRPKSSA